jgi:phosphatidylserine/phosphatidylglycerophosphate/cardiolipin synthase-like enzyme
METLIHYLETTLADEVLSKSEKRDFKSLLAEANLDSHERSFLRSKIYELAAQRANENNYRFILDWVKAATSALTPAETPATSAASDAYFSPGEACRKVIVTQIEKAVRQLHICVFTISDDQITKSLLLAHAKKVNIRIITDNDKSFDEGSDVKQLARAGISVRMDATPNHMHHKFMVADDQTLITGSYNWTLSAARYNHENILLTREPGVIRSFTGEFDSLWKNMLPYNP